MVAKAKKAAKKRVPVGTEVEVVVILDRSGSMGSCRQGTISGYNEYLNGLRKDKATKYWVSLTQFDTNGRLSDPELTVCYLNQPLADVPDLTETTYEPRGGTPLYDAIGEVLRRVKVKERPVLAVIITDGEENSSKEFTLDAVKKLIKEKEADGWTFVFLGADFDAYAAGAQMGMAAVNTANYSKGRERAVYSVTASATMDWAAQRRTSGLRGQSLGEVFLTDDAKDAMGDQTSGGGTAVPSAFPEPKRSWTVRQP